MNVCMVVYSFYEVDTRVMQYANALAGRGDTVDVLALGLPGQPRHESIGGVHVHRIQARRVNERTRFAYLWRLLRFLVLSCLVLSWKHFVKRYKLVHIHNVPDFLVFSALVLRLCGTPVILDIHDLMPEMYADKFSVSRDSLAFKALLGVERISISFSTHTIIANDIWHERLLSRSVHAGKLTTIRNYPDPQIFHSYPTVAQNGKFLILYPGSLNWYQGVDVAVKAFARVAAQMPGAEFHIYGEGPSRPALMDLAKNLDLGDRVRFCGYVPAADIARVMSSADLAIEPKQARSHFANEASSTKILEFMAVDVPLLVSRTSIHAHYFDDSVVKFFNPSDDAELASHILFLYRNPNVRQQLVANAARYVARNNWNVKKQDYLALVDRLVDPHQPQKTARMKENGHSAPSGQTSDSPVSVGTGRPSVRPDSADA
ncbi:MAG TPA: glycosyltransferase family 4 protein [Candidatus Cybelea sp.]|nr:glycosyltransferase family 4 protein [Candidatus Cybelea sp.]